MENDAERIREKVLRLIDLKYESDVAFERAAELPPKTVSNWRRGRSTTASACRARAPRSGYVSYADISCR